MIDNGTATESLREQVMIAQFQRATGCTKEQARQILQTARWEFEMALSIFFQECSIPQQQSWSRMDMIGNDAVPIAPSNGGHLGPMCAPCNTPSTPPNFPETLLAMQQLQAGGGGTGFDWSMGGRDQNQQTTQQAPKVLTTFNPMPPPCNRYFQSCDWPATTVTSSPPKNTQFTSSLINGDALVVSADYPTDQHRQLPTIVGISENNSPMEGDPADGVYIHQFPH